MNSENFESFFNDVSIYLNNSNEDILAFISDVSSDMSKGTKTTFTLLKSIDDFNDVFSNSEEIIVENFYPSVHNNDMFTTAYNIIGSACNYVYDFFWGK